MHTQDKHWYLLSFYSQSGGRWEILTTLLYKEKLKAVLLAERKAHVSTVEYKQTLQIDPGTTTLHSTTPYTFALASHPVSIKPEHLFEALTMLRARNIRQDGYTFFPTKDCMVFLPSEHVDHILNILINNQALVDSALQADKLLKYKSSQSQR